MNPRKGKESQGRQGKRLGKIGTGGHRVFLGRILFKWKYNVDITAYSLSSRRVTNYYRRLLSDIPVVIYHCMLY